MFDVRAGKRIHKWGSPQPDMARGKPQIPSSMAWSNQYVSAREKVARPQEPAMAFVNYTTIYNVKLEESALVAVVWYKRRDSRKA
jgi:hypothetical protein